MAYRPSPRGPHQEGLEDPLLPDALGEGLEVLKAPAGLGLRDKDREGHYLRSKSLLLGGEAHGLTEHTLHNAHLGHLLLSPDACLRQEGLCKGPDFSQKPLVPHRVDGQGPVDGLLVRTWAVGKGWSQGGDGGRLFQK
jgi:hypothetical protein